MIVFQHIQGDAGLIFMLPIYIYLFVTALGTDYNILMIARLREEAREGRNPHDAAAEAVKHAGPTIAAAGVILAGTFASLMLGGNSLIVSMGFALRSASSSSAFVMSMFFTPALTALIGHAAWWPGHGDEKREEPDGRPRSRLSLTEARLLGADGGVVAVAGVYDGVVGQREQPGPDRLDDQVGVAEGAAGRAGPALEERVAGEDTAEVGGVQADGAGRVAGGVQHGQRGAADLMARPSERSTSHSSSVWVSSHSGLSSGAAGSARRCARRSAGATRTWSSWAWVQRSP